MFARTSFLFAVALISAATASVATAFEFRTIDGSGNNLANPAWGEAETALVRIRDVLVDPLSGFNPALLAPAYEDGIDAPRGMIDPNNPPGIGTSILPNPRDISNHVSAQGDRSRPNTRHATDWLWQWGQFIDHDISLEEPQPTSDPLLIPVQPIDAATGEPDPLFNPAFPFLPFRRNDPAPGTGAGTGVPREQVNALTAYIDGSQVYGSDAARADFLRTMDGTGMLKTTTAAGGETLLPLNRAVDPFPNANPPLQPGDTPPPPEDLFLAGDPRSNEQVGLTAVHTLFVREHNHWADQIAGRPDLGQLVIDAGLDPGNPSDVGEVIYQISRKIVGAEIQAITYNEFLPLLIGPGALPEYQGYDPAINASISNEFANAAYRVGHTLLSPEIELGVPAAGGQTSIKLRDGFFNPQFVKDNGVDSLILGLASQEAQDVDGFVIDEVRNFLFAEGNGGLDLAAVNIQRGRDHGLPSYNDMREGLGLPRVTSFGEITSDPLIAARLEAAYPTVDEIDLWPGAISEDEVGGGLVGETLRLILADQFLRSRDGDRFFYLNDPHLLALVPELPQTRLSDVILRNTSIASIQGNVFVAVPEPGTAGMLLCLACWLTRCRRRRVGIGSLLVPRSGPGNE